jgi:hypothetical protein
MANTPKQIGPSETLKEYLTEALALEEFRGRGKKSKQGASIGARDQLRLRNNDEAKVRTIDNLFESIANLIYFFQFVNNHPEILYRFKEDIEDLLGLAGQSQLHIDAKNTPFSMLIREFIGTEYTDKNFDYRPRLLHVLQFLVNQKSDEIMMKIDEVPTLNDWQMRSMMHQDMKRAQIWMGYLDKFVVNKTVPKRVIDLG